MSVRGTSALALGGIAYLASWAFGSRSLAVVGLGLVLAGVAALGWTRLARGPITVRTRAVPAPASEGDTIRLDVEIHQQRALPLGSISLEAHWLRLGTRRVDLRGVGRTARGEVRIDAVPRGIHRADRVSVVREDPLGLERVVRAVPTLPPLVVRPRVVELDSLFAEGMLDGTPTRVRRPRAGAADIRSVRPYREGEPLRGVHWPTTARRGVLTMKELEDGSDGQPVLLLDCDPSAAFGRPPDTPFEAAVRAAGSVAATVAAQGRSMLLLTTGRGARVVRVGPRAASDALDALAGVEPDARVSVAIALGHARGPLAAARELIVVTSRIDATVIGALRSRASAVVWVDAASWSGRTGGHPAGIASLIAAGVQVAILRRGDDIATVLERGRRLKARAHG